MAVEDFTIASTGLRPVTRKEKEKDDMSRLNFLLGIALLMLLAIPTMAGAWTIDSPFGTSITNSCTIVWGTGNDSVSVGSDTTVAAIYGDTVHKPVGSANANVGETVVYTYTLNNTGNSGSTYAVAFNSAPLYGGAGAAAAWRFELGNGADSITYSAIWGLTPGPGDSVFIGPIAEDAATDFYLAICPADTAGYAPDASWGGCSIAIGSTQTTTAYAGDNGYAYAENTSNIGDDNLTSETVTISGAVFAVTKNCTATLGGADWTPVPGATLVFNINYNNTGGGAGSNVVIYDEIDTSVIAFTDGTIGVATGWTFEVGPSDVTDYSFGSGDFFAEGAIPDATVRWIRWTKANVASAENGYHSYATTIY